MELEDLSDKKTKMKVHLDATSNIIKFPEIRKQIEKNLRKDFEKELPNRLKRMGKVPSFITTDVGIYTQLFEEAKQCYNSGLYHATIAMIGIATERFSIELSTKIIFKINENKITEKDLFGRDIQKQWLRLDLLEKSKVLKPEYVKKLKKIEIIRNKYVHPKEKGDAKKDSLKVLKLFIEILKSRFSDSYSIKDGKIVKKDTKK
jgi:hypothetical protein